VKKYLPLKGKIATLTGSLLRIGVCVRQKDWFSDRRKEDAKTIGDK
jgi:hypothetical protein